MANRRRREPEGWVASGGGVTVTRTPGDPTVINFRIEALESDPRFRVTGTWRITPRGLILTQLCIESKLADSRFVGGGGGGLDSLLRALPPKEAAGAPLGITTKALRLSLADLESRTRAAIRQQAEAHESLTETARSLLADADSDLTQADAIALQSFLSGHSEARKLEDELGPILRHPGRRGHPSGHYEWIAERYVDLTDDGVSRGVLNRIAEEASERLGREVTSANVRDWVFRARELGFLSPARGKGIGGAMAGPALRRPQPPESVAASNRPRKKKGDNK